MEWANWCVAGAPENIQQGDQDGDTTQPNQKNIDGSTYRFDTDQGTKNSTDRQQQRRRPFRRPCKDGNHVIHCNSVREAWNFVYPHPPHLIVIHLNDLNRAGLADLHECRALASGVPIILATSARVTPAVTKALENRTAGILSLSLAIKTKRDPLNKTRIGGMRR